MSVCICLDAPMYVLYVCVYLFGCSYVRTVCMCVFCTESAILTFEGGELAYLTAPFKAYLTEIYAEKMPL